MTGTGHLGHIVTITKKKRLKMGDFSDEDMEIGEHE